VPLLIGLCLALVHGNGETVATRMLVVAMAALSATTDESGASQRSEENNQLLRHADIKAILDHMTRRKSLRVDLQTFAPPRLTTDASPTGFACKCPPPNRLRFWFRGTANRRWENCL